MKNGEGVRSKRQPVLKGYIVNEGVKSLTTQ